MDQNHNAEVIRIALDRILESRTFERSARARDMVRYVVEQDLDDKGDLLKGFSIAVDVFGKSEDFDPTIDPLVRVHAGRLRELLASYYSGEGATDRIRISILKGKYVPDYSRADLPLENRKADDLEVADSAYYSEPDKPAPREIESADTDVRDRPLTSNGRQMTVETRERDLKSYWSPKGLYGVAAVCLGLVGLALYLGVADQRWVKGLVDHRNIVPDPAVNTFELPVLHVISDLQDNASSTFAGHLVHNLSAFDSVTALQVHPLDVMDKMSGQWGGLEYALNVINTGKVNDTGSAVFRVVLLNLQQEKVLRSEEYGGDIWPQAGI